MKTTRSLITAACVLVVAVAALAAEPSRTAKIEDTSGVKTDVTNLRCSFSTANAPRFSGARGCISITTSGYEVAIPASCLISITSSGDKAEVRYSWRGQERTISGTLAGNFGGESDFGHFSLSASKLRQLTFTDAPTPEKTEQRYGTRYSASAVLTNGMTLSISSFQRHASYFSTAGYIAGGQVVYNHYTDFRFMRGESLATVEFAAIRKLEFSDGDTVTVTLKNGNTTSGKLSTVMDAGVVGWTGETEQGLVFLAPSLVRAVEFGESSAADKKGK
jgi:hypothetical protein